MFWRFGFHTASSIDTLLDKDDQSLVTLDALLDEDDLLQECKAQNTRLVDYFQRVDVLGRLLGWVSGEFGGAFEEDEERQEQRGMGMANTTNRSKYPYIATEVLCSEIWSIVETCVSSHPDELLTPFWNAVLEKSPEDLKCNPSNSNSHVAAHFAKVNAIFLSKKPAEMLNFIQKQSDVIGRILRHIENPSFVDLLVRIIQLDEYAFGHDGAVGALEWLSSERLIPRLIDMLSPAHPPDMHQVVSDLIKGIISMATPSPGAGLTANTSAISNNADAASGISSNQFARELAREDSVSKLIVFILQDFSASSAEFSSSSSESEDGVTHFEAASSSAIHAMGVITELIRKNNSDYFEPYLFHTLRNRLIGVQQGMMQQGDNKTNAEGRDSRDILERAMRDMVERMGVVNLGFVLHIICDSERLDRLVGYLRKPRSLRLESADPGSTPSPALTFERFRITELLAELLHCSNMALLNRPLRYQHLYDAEGRLQGGLGGLEELARVISMGSEDEDGDDHGGDGRDDNMDTEIEPALELPITSASSSNMSSLLDSDEDEDMSSSSEDDSMDMEEIAMYDEPQLHSTTAEPPPLSPEVDMHYSEPQEASNSSNSTDNPSTDSASLSRSQSRRSSRRLTLPNTSSAGVEPLVIGERLKKRFLELNVLGVLLDLFFEFPWNNFLHNTVYDIFHQILTGQLDSGSRRGDEKIPEEKASNDTPITEGSRGYNRELIISLFRDAKLMHRIIEGQRLNDEESAKPRTPRLGFMGHLTLISEDVLTAIDRYPSSLREEIMQYAPNGSENGQGDWDEYVTGRYRETKVRDTRLLGGGKPATGLGGTSSLSGEATKWKVDEEEMGSEPRRASGSTSGETGSEETTELRGEFHRSATGKPRREASADFGVAPTSMDDDDEYESGHSLRRFSDDDDDDGDEHGGWLSRSSTFSTTTERRPLGTSGFDDVFDPGASSHSSLRDPFADDDFGPFTAPTNSNTSSSEDPFSFSSSFSDDMEGMDSLDDSAFDDNFGDFGDFGEFQSAVTSSSNTVDSGPVDPTKDGDTPSDGELTPTAGSWISDLSATEGDGDSLNSSLDSIESNREKGVGLGLDLAGGGAVSAKSVTSIRDGAKEN